jgi:plasmid stabilization system protein ParE
MKIEWTSKALSDLARLYDFLASVNEPAAARVVRSLAVSSMHLQEQPHIGEQLLEFNPRDVRRIFVERYEMRYEIQESIIYILRVWHMKEDR